MNTELEDWHRQNTEKAKSFMNGIPLPEEKPLLTHEKVFMSSDVTFGDSDNFLFFVAEALKRLAIVSASSDTRLYFYVRWFKWYWQDTNPPGNTGMWMASIRAAAPVEGLIMFREHGKLGRYVGQREEIQLP